MEKESQKLKMKNQEGRSLTFKVIRSVALSCVILGLLTLIIGITIYGVTLTRDYIRLAGDTAQQAAMSVSHGSEHDTVTAQIMSIYNSLSDAEREAMGQEKYRALFSDLMKKRSYYYLEGILNSYYHHTSVYDVYLAVPDKESGALVILVETNKDLGIEPGEKKPVSEKFLTTFLDWDGVGERNLILPGGKNIVTCTVGEAIRDAQDTIISYLFVDVTLRDMFAELGRYALAIALAVFVVTAVVTWLHAGRMRRTVTNPINAIAGAAQAYVSDKRSGSRNNDHFNRLNIHTGDEIENLSRSMADMERDLLEIEKNLTAVTAENERISTELALARRIQTESLPNVFPPFPERKEFDIYAVMDPAKEVGGDFYDFFLLDDEHLGLVIADVSGKGVPAALFMMIAKMMVQNYALLGGSPGEVLEMVNRQICKNNRESMFVTVWLGILDLKSGHLTAANAGHECPVLKRPGQSFDLVKDRHGLFVGVRDGVKYQNYELHLEKGSRLFLFTDGVTEAMNAGKKLFGTDRLLKSLAEAEDESPQKILAHVRKSIDDYVGEAPQFDDITMLCLAYNGPETPVAERSYPAKLESIREASAFIRQELDALDCPPKAQMDISIAIDEIMSNIAFYAYSGSSGEVTVRLEPLCDPRGARLTFIDSGITYNPLDAPEPDVTRSARERQAGGLGIYLVRKKMDDTSYKQVNGRNILTLTKYFQEKP